MSETKIKINGKEFSIVPLRLRGWSALEELRRIMEVAVSNHDLQSYFETLVQFIETALPSSKGIDWTLLPWYEFLEIFSLVSQANMPTMKFPILEENKKEEEKLPWEYLGRTWFFWLNLFARIYGWNEDKIAELEIDSAIGLYQEIVLDEQFKREWEWGLSEIAYPYDESSKSAKFHPLDRPNWMMPLAPEPKTVKIRTDMIPLGNIILDTENGS
jgi:hypothetical protein